MDVSDAIRGRRSVRGFEPDQVEDEDLHKILDAARWAPSAGNLQPWEFVVVKDRDVKRRLARAALGQNFIVQAPVNIVVCANIPRTSWRYGERGSKLYSVQDTAAATQNIHLMAYSLGYATCWVGAFDEDKVVEAINAPEDIKPVAIIPIGKTTRSPTPPPRRPLQEIIHQEKF